MYKKLLFLLFSLIFLEISQESPCGYCACHINDTIADCTINYGNSMNIDTILNFLEIFSKIQRIVLDGQNINELQDSIFSSHKLRQLNYIAAANCTIQKVSANSFSNLTELEILDLHKNRIEMLPRGLFKENKKLKQIYFDYNKINSLEDGLMDDLTWLSTVSFHGNNISYIGENFFKHNTNLATVSLSENKLHYLNGLMFDHHTSLRTLSVYKNPWNCTCQMQPLFQTWKKTAPTEQLKNLTVCSSPPSVTNLPWNRVEDLICSNIIVTKKYDANNEQILLTCQIESNSSIVADWYKGDIRQKAERINNKRHIHIYQTEIDKKDVKSAGEIYFCKVNDTLEKDIFVSNEDLQKNTKIIIKKPQYTIRDRIVTNISIPENNEKELLCRTFDYNIKWKFKYFTFNTNKNSSKYYFYNKNIKDELYSVLMIVNISANDEGIYKCINETAEHFFNVFVSKPTELLTFKSYTYTSISITFCILNTVLIILCGYVLYYYKFRVVTANNSVILKNTNNSQGSVEYYTEEAPCYIGS